MGFSKPRAPAATPPPVTYTDVADDQGQVSRSKNRKRLASAVNTRSSILSEGQGSGKTLLGQ